MTAGLKLIGAAFPRTGTMSVKRALESLGFGLCYHMNEVFLNPDHVPIWNATFDGKMPDWQNLFAKYSGTLDMPACHYWKELAVAFPKAKILLLQRDPEMWYESMLCTAYQVIMGPGGETDPALKMARRLFLNKFMSGRFEDRDFAITTYRSYCKNVIEEMPKKRLLVYEVTQGWEPLCNFLEFDVPNVPFPKMNTRENFRARNRLP